MRYQKNIIFFIKIFFFISISIQAQFIIPEKPKKIYPINDFSRILENDKINILNQKLIKINKEKSIEIVISIIDSIKEENISMIATEWGQRWQIGQKKESNGIFILLVSKDKKITIQTGYGIEPYLTDIVCKNIINQIIPYLKQEKYYFAINQIINMIYAKIKEYDNKNKNISNYHFIEINILLIIFLLYLYRLFNSKQDSLKEESLMPPPPNLPIYNHENDEDNNFDGFGGGGNFGGGGASDNW